MMERSGRIFTGRKGVVVAVVIIMECLSAPAHCQTPDTALLIQHRPVQGGITTPPAGVHHFKMGSKVILTAVPETGYRFVFWMGDVLDPNASNTIVFLDEPKVIVAIFERTGKDILVAGGGGAGGSPRMTLNRGWIINNRRLFLIRFTQNVFIIPEPATGVLLVLGSLALLGRRKA